jgi:hyaluronoglucosaminidase
MAVTPDGRTVLVLTSAGVTGVTSVDALMNRAGKPVAIQGAYALGVAPGGTAYVLATPDPNSQQGLVFPVHIRAGTAGTPIKVGLNSARIAFTPDGKMAYVAIHASQSVTPIRLADGRAGPTIAAGKIPTRLAVSPDSTTVYVLDSNIFGGLGPEIPFGAQVRPTLRMTMHHLGSSPEWHSLGAGAPASGSLGGKPAFYEARAHLGCRLGDEDFLAVSVEVFAPGILSVRGEPTESLGAAVGRSTVG